MDAIVTQQTDIVPWQPNPRQRVLIQKMTRFPYPKMAEAARKLRLSQDTVRHWNQDPQFRRCLAAAYDADQREVREEMQRRLLSLVPLATQVKLRALQSDDLALASSTASWVLDRVTTAAAEDPTALREEIELFRTVVLTAIEKAAPDVRAAIEESLRRHQPLLDHPDESVA